MESIDNLENMQAVSIEEQLEAASQNLYECKLQLSTAKALEKDYQNEIEILQRELVQEREKTEAKILSLEKSAEETKTSFDEQLRCLENELLYKNEIILNLELNLEQLRTPPELPDHSEVDTLKDEIDKLKQKQDLLEENLKILKASNTDYLKLNTILDDKLKVTKLENENMRESLEVQKEELIKANDAVQNLQDEALCLKSELESLKSKPFEAKGNSLFSEVDDRRVELQSTIDTMKTKYLDMKRERTKHLNIIASLNNENAILCERRKTEILEWNEDINILEEGLKDEIRTLEDLIENYKKQIANYEKQHQGLTSGSCDKFKYFETALNKKQKEITSLLEKIEKISLGERTLSYELVDVRRDQRKWMFKASKLECEVNKLKAENQILKTQLDENDQQVILSENIEDKPKFILKSNLKQAKRPVLPEVAEDLDKTKVISPDINSKENRKDVLSVKRESCNVSDNKENTITNTKKVVFCDNKMNNVNCERLSSKRSLNKRGEQ